MCAIKVLVVDDDKVICQILVACLEDRGYVANSVNSGEEALASVGEGDYQVVITDLKMAEIDGHEVTRRIKKHAPGVKVVMMTGCTQQKEREAAYKNGVDAYFHKPFDMEKLMAEIEPITTNLQCS